MAVWKRVSDENMIVQVIWCDICDIWNDSNMVLDGYHNGEGLGHFLHYPSKASPTDLEQRDVCFSQSMDCSSSSKHRPTRGMEQLCLRGL